MIAFSHTLEIARPVDEVYDYLADLEKIPEWNWALSTSRKVTSGPAAPGTRYEVVRQVPTYAVEELFIVALEPSRRVKVEGALGPFDAQLDYRLDPVEGGTRLVNVVRLARSMPFITQSIARIGISGAVRSNLDELRRRLETASGAGLRARPPLSRQLL